VVPSGSSGNTLQFNVTAPSVAGTSFYVQGRLSSGALFTQSAFNLFVIGTPTQLSSLSCVGVASQSALIRAGDTVACSVTPRDGAGVATSAFASDFLTPVILPSGTATALSTVDVGSTFMFYFNASSGLLARQTVSVTVSLLNGTAFVGGAVVLTIVGRPTSNSTLSCLGQSGSTPYVYPSSTLLCTITVRDSAGNTTGLAEDFGQALSVGGSSISLPAAIGDNSLMTFTLVAPATANSALTVTGIMADSTPFTQGAISVLVMGSASRFSNVTCAPMRDFGVFSVRTSEEVACTIYIKDTSAVSTTAVVSDFASPVVVGGSVSTALVSTLAYRLVIFNVTVSASSGALFTVTGRLSNNLLFIQGTFTIPVVGLPTTASQLNCAGNRSLTTVVRVGEVTNCYYNIRDSGSWTIGDATDFLPAVIVGGTGATGLVSVSPQQLYFSVVAPSTVGAAFSAVGRLANNANFTQGPVSLTVVGIPTVDSLLSCAGAVSGNTIVKAGEIILCTITVRDGSSATTGVVGDFAVYSTSVTGSLVSSADYSIVTFNVTAPSAVGARVIITGALASGSNFSQGALTVVVAGTPTVDSSMVCVGVRSGTTFVRVNENVNCTITARDGPSSLTTSVPTDFASPLTLNGQAVSAVFGGSGQEQPSIWQAANITSPAAVGAPFRIVGRLADGRNFSQGPLSLTVVGTPASGSTLSCVGVRSGNGFVRVNDIVACTIVIRDGSNAVTTGVVADFQAPVVVNGQLQTGLVLSGDMMAISFNLTAGNAIGSNASITVQLQDGSQLNVAYVTIVTNPSTQSRLVCVGQISNAGLNVRPGETVGCTISIRDANNQATLGQPDDYRSPTVVGGTSLSALSQGTSTSIVFTVVAPNSYGATFTILGLMQNGSSFDQGPLSLLVAYFPDLVSWSLSLNNVDNSGSDLGGLLVFNFRATVNTGSFNTSAMRIVSNNTMSPVVSYQFTTSTIGFNGSDAANTTRTFLLSAGDTDAIKLLSKQGFATLASNTYLTISSGSGLADAVVTTDIHRVLVGADALQASLVQQDVTSPFLTSFALFNNNLSTLTLVFNEPVLASSFNGSALFLGSSYNDANAVRMSTNTITTSGDGRTIGIQLASTDVNSIELTRVICASISSCFISFESGLISDLNRNPVVPMQNTLNFNTLLVRLPQSFVSDQTGPALTSFSVNMTAGAIALTFSKVVSRTTLSVAGIRLQALQNGTTPGLSTSYVYNLVSGTSSSPDGTVINLQLSAADILAIKSSFIGTSAANTYMSLSSSVVQDLNLPPLANQPIAAEFALQAASFFPDIVAPRLVSFSLLLAQSTLTLTFDKPMLAAPYNLSLLVLQNAANASSGVTLSSAVITGDHSTVLSVGLSTVDTDAIVATRSIGTSAALTFLNVMAGWAAHALH